MSPLVILSERSESKDPRASGDLQERETLPEGATPRAGTWENPGIQGRKAKCCLPSRFPLSVRPTGRRTQPPRIRMRGLVQVPCTCSRLRRAGDAGLSAGMPRAGPRRFGGACLPARRRPAARRQPPARHPNNPACWAMVEGCMHIFSRYAPSRTRKRGGSGPESGRSPRSPPPPLAKPQVTISEESRAGRTKAHFAKN